eukprot:71895-Rhodomonas_salina.3
MHPAHSQRMREYRLRDRPVREQRSLLSNGVFGPHSPSLETQNRPRRQSKQIPQFKIGWQKILVKHARSLSNRTATHAHRSVSAMLLNSLAKPDPLMARTARLLTTHVGSPGQGLTSRRREGARARWRRWLRRRQRARKAASLAAGSHTLLPSCPCASHSPPSPPHPPRPRTGRTRTARRPSSSSGTSGSAKHTTP